MALQMFDVFYERCVVYKEYKEFSRFLYQPTLLSPYSQMVVLDIKVMIQKSEGELKICNFFQLKVEEFS